jgi:ureidoglycolate lyase
MQLLAEPLQAESFARFGEVLEAPNEPGRLYFDAGLGNGRPGARASLSVAHVAALPELPLVATKMERHEFSSQSFMPLDVERWLIVVAPTAADGGPEEAHARAFVAGPHQGITYRPNTWHHSLTVLDRLARFAIFMWLDGTERDEEFVTLRQPFTVIAPSRARKADR